MRLIASASMVAALAISTNGAGASDRADYERRVAARLVEAFQTLDRNGDQAVTRGEAHGDVNFVPLFASMDIDRDGIVTRAELDRYIVLNHHAAR